MSASSSTLSIAIAFVVFSRRLFANSVSSGSVIVTNTAPTFNNNNGQSNLAKGDSLISNISNAQVNRRVTSGQNLGRNGLIDVSQILTRSGRGMGAVIMQKKSCRYLLPFEHNART